MELLSLRVRGLVPYRTEQTVDLTALQGPLVAVVGPNGAGKSTLLELLHAALYRRCPTRGRLVELATDRNAFLELTARVNGRVMVFRHLLDGATGKSEAFVDVDGVPAVASGKVRHFDEWVAQHLPAEDVVLASLFSAQASTGFLGARPGERKAILLRALGHDRLERMAEQARERVRGLRGELAAVDARIEETEPRTALEDGAAEQARERVAFAQEQVEKAERSLAGALASIAIERVAAPRRKELRQRTAQLSELREKLAAGDRKLAEIRARIEDAPEPPPEGAVDAARGALAFAQEAEHATRQRWVALTAERKAAEAEVSRARSAVTRHLERMEEAKRALEQAERAAPTEDAFNSARRQVGHLNALIEETGTALAAARDARVAGADERISLLREGLSSIALGEHALGDGPPAHEIAESTLEADESLDEAARLAPVRVRELDAEVARLRSELDTARREREGMSHALNRLAALRESVDLDVLRERLRVVEEERELAEARVTELTSSCGSAERATTDAAGRTKAIACEVVDLEKRHRESTAVDKDRVRLEEAAPRRAELVAEIDALDALIASTPEPAPWPHRLSPDEEEKTWRGIVSQTQSEARIAERELAAAEQAEKVATEARTRLASLVDARREVAEQLGDWTKVAADLGRDGLQAMELDAAGPSLSTLATDLLHRAFGPRWTVSFETLRSSADGKRELETLEVRVLDTETGYEGPVEALSGGERAIVGEAVSLALTVLACRAAGMERPTLVRDETGAALDPAKTEAYVRMLRIAAELVDASRVLVVSHDPRVAEMADSRIEIAAGVIAGATSETPRVEEAA